MSNKFEIEIKNTLTVTAEDIDDIMSAAFEGGINYWCGKAKVIGEYLGEYASEQISRGGCIRIYDAETDDTWVLTREKLLNGIKLAYQDNVYSDYEWCNGKSLDCCMIDAEVADVIIQYALFEEIVFG